MSRDTTSLDYMTSFPSSKFAPSWTQRVTIGLTV